MNKIKGLVLAAASGLFAMPLSAATVSLVPASGSVSAGGQFVVDLVLDATDGPDAHPGAFLGTVQITFDAALAQYDGFAINAPIEFLGDEPSVGTGSVSLGFQNAPDTSVIGSFTFTALGAAGDTIHLTMTDGLPVLGSFANTVPTNTPSTPTFVNGEVSVVPIPAAIWLFVSGLGVLGWRRSATA